MVLGPSWCWFNIVLKLNIYLLYNKKNDWFSVPVTGSDLETAGASSHEFISDRNSSASAANKLAAIVSTLLQCSLQPSSLPTYRRAWQLFTRFFNAVFHEASFFTLPVSPSANNYLHTIGETHLVAIHPLLVRTRIKHCLYPKKQGTSSLLCHLNGKHLLHMQTNYV